MDGGTDADPSRLLANSNLSFTGGYPYGSGFLFDDDDVDASTVQEMTTLLDRHPDYQQFIFPYLGGEEMLKGTDAILRVTFALLPGRFLTTDPFSVTPKRDDRVMFTAATFQAKGVAE